MNDFDEKDLLIRELRERSGDVTGNPISFHDVRQSAKKMQRRRNIVGGAVAAVVATVTIPGGLAVTAALNDTEAPVEEPTFAASPSEATPRPQPIPRPDGTFPLTLDGLTRGTDPQVPYVDGVRSALVTPDGSMGLQTSYQQITPYNEGWLALGYEGDGAEMFMLDASMKVTHSFPSGTSFAVSEDGTQVLYVQIEADGSQTLVNAPANGLDPQTWTFPKAPAVEPIGLLDQGTAVFETLAQDGTTTAGLASAEGITELEGFVGVEDANMATGLVIGQTVSDQINGSCWGVMDPSASTTEMIWETCDYGLKSFSPDGGYIAAGGPERSGFGDSTLTVLDAAGHEPVVEFTNSRTDPAAFLQGAWEDEDSVLGVVSDGATYRIERFELDGHVESASDPVEMDPNFGDIPFWFGAGGW